MDSKVIQAGMFDNKSTGQERRQFLQNILKNETDTQDDDSEVPDDETVNQMIARTEEEFELFQRMDIERRRMEARDTNRKPRLMEESELPAWLLKDDKELEKMRIEAEEAELYGRGTRVRKEVDYSDSLTEKEFLKAVEEGNLDEVSETKKRKRSMGGKGKRSSKYGNDDSINDADDLDTGDGDIPSSGGAAGGSASNDASKAPVKRKRGRPAASSSSTNNTPSKGGAGGGRSGSASPSSAKLALQMRTLMDLILKYADREGRVLSEPFLQLPTRRELPDYYDVIKKPIDLKKFVLFFFLVLFCFKYLYNFLLRELFE